VLLFSRGRDGEREPLAPGALLREMERIARQTFPKNLNLAALAPADLWPVLGNATQLHQVLLNLCVNARDAMPAGGELTLAADNVELTTDEAAQIPNSRPGKFVMLLVADTGAGIPPEILPRIFEPFFTTKAADKGTGLGLSTTARIINAHSGFVNVRSEPGSGTSVEIYLPAAAIAPATDAQKISPAAWPRGNGELILIVDDEQSVREMISLALTAQGFRVLTAANGAEAVTLAQQHAAELKLVLLDDDMPVMSGRSALPQLRAFAPGARIVLMSGEAGSFSETDGVKPLSKPFELETLLKIVAGNVG
jgi:CheY-like chemotaxis protein